jgi:hydroxymethylpyrimidine pyrophosphatase-like HAD family hydrolase
MKTLYVSDLDGTLFRDDVTLSPYTRRELVELIREGVPITIASARSIYSIRPLLGNIPFRLPIIEANGAFVTDYATGRKEIIRSLGRESAHMAFGAILAAGCKPFITGHGGSGDFLYFRDVSNPGMAAYVRERREFGDERMHESEDLRAVLDAPANRITSLSVIDKEERLIELAREICGPSDGTLVSTVFEYRNCPGWYFFTLHDRLATKDHAIRFLRSGWGLEEAELVVFGDDVNDEGMFRMADRCIAPSNAKAGIRALAHEIIGSNQEDSVVRYIRGREGLSGS